MRMAVFFQLRLRLSLQNTAELLNPDSLTQLGTNFGGWSRKPLVIMIDPRLIMDPKTHVAAKLMINGQNLSTGQAAHARNPV